MNRRELFKTISATAFVAGFAGVARAQTVRPAVSPRQVLSLDKGWRFHEGDIPMPPITNAYDASKAGNAMGAAAVKYDDSAWPQVTLPHDFASAQPFDKDAQPAQGYRKRGNAWYRNTLLFTGADHGKHIELQLDGMATFATVWFNGILVDRNWSGYTSAYIDLTPYVYYDKPNQLAIRVDATAMEGWWYEGAGLYRHAWIVKRDPLHIVTDGVFANPVKDGDTWIIPVEVTLNNSGTKTAQVSVISELRDPAGKVMGAINAQAACDPLGQSVIRMSLPVGFAPDLWSPETPVVYSVATRVEQGGRVLDAVTTPCGFRTTRWDADQGFFLNDRHVKIKGVCLHQDHAGVGTAIPENVIDYRLKRLKSLGCNAIRFSHNAQNTYLMHACDRMGFLVMAENRNFDASPDYIAQLQWLVRRDRNHPSIYLWSVFNEEPMQATEQGYEMVRRMSAAVKTLDTTRPVTAAMSGGLDAAISVAEAVDVVGINYQQDKYDLFHKAHPEKPVFSSEDTSAFMTRGEYKTDKDRHIMASYDDEAAGWGETQRDAWQAVVERPYVGGQFVWTGLDYHGEPTPFLWPSNSSYFGILDLCGFDKAAAYIHRAQWIDATPQLDLVPHWNWQAGEKVRVMACTNADEVELFVNGQSAGKQKGDRLRMNYWTVDYAPGFIEARGFNGGKLVSKVRHETTGKAVALRLTADLNALTANGRDATPVKVEAIDAKGRNVPLAQDMVHFTVTGGAIIGLGNGDPTSLEAEKGSQRSLFNGLAQVIVQTGAAAGSLTLTASADGLKPASVAIKLTPGGFTAPWRAPGDIADQPTA
ncbi:beta-galactosidase GalA [Asticcacaulis sp. EMRT-3]|uniref:beta-galactosidase GalA n=1 Tax=Asticcacaulis sp. EMRT-3 TaxID=3040349 RepID=UPI0024AF3EBD|nr:beta-galactosidase GalA [Asticcacaulis sp. EMRT-3]MDI7774116.1 beta-galactosidase GalA [Asticcacaulis sp. EMRT-3]